MRLVIGNGVALTLSGIAIGATASFALTRLMSSLLYDIGATDPLTFVFSGLLFTAVAVAASTLPAHKATRIDPADALRT